MYFCVYRKLEQFDRPHSATPSPAISPVHSNNSNSSPPQQKRPVEEDNCDNNVEPAAKKPRVAHNRQQEKPKANNVIPQRKPVEPSPSPFSLKLNNNKGE